MKKQIIMAVCLLLSTLCAQGQTISTVAGTGTGGFSGDGASATSAMLSTPRGVAIDATDNIYIADKYNHRIRKVNTTGTISTFAGSTLGFSGDGGPATAAQLYQPLEVKVSASGNVYIVDNGRIRQINSLGIITTVACNGTYGYTGDGGPATAAEIAIGGIAIDAIGNIYIGASTRIRKVNASGIISTIAGTGVAGFSGDGSPATGAQFNDASSLAVDAAGNLYICDQARIRKINTAGIISTIAGTGTSGYSGDGGPATAADISVSSTGITVDGSGNIYFAEELSHRIRKIDASGNITTYAGTGTSGYTGDGGAATAATLFYPSSAACSGAGVVYICDQNNNVIRKANGSTASTHGLHTMSYFLQTFPNPVVGSFSILLSSTMHDEKAELVFRNVIGEKMKEITFMTNKPIDIPLDFPTGIYFLSITTANAQWCEKIVKK